MSATESRRPGRRGLSRPLAPLVRSLDAARREGIERDPFERDPALVARMLPWLEAVEAYMGVELRGWENVPSDEPILFVGNHSGGASTLDAVPLLAKWIRERGPESPLYALSYDLLFGAPGVSSLLRSAGCVPASHHNAERALDKGASVVVFPGGDYEVFRPWSQRNEIHFHYHTGFVELAIRKGVRVVPMTIHGAHETTFVLTRGRQIARRLGFERLRVKVFPIIWSIPFGPAPAFVPSLQLPSKVTVELGKTLDWTRHDPEAADDPVVLQQCYAEITDLMQATLDRLSQEIPHPVLTRLNELRPSRVARRWWRGRRSR